MYLKSFILFCTLLLGTTAMADNIMSTDGAKTEVLLGGRMISCGGAGIIMDNSLPSEGAGSMPGTGNPADGNLWLNPKMLMKQPEQVRLFVFYHECGHLHDKGVLKNGRYVERSEYEAEFWADEWATRTGVEMGWLTKPGTKEVCNSFEDAPDTSSHPAGQKRCDRIFKLYNELQTTNIPRAAAPIITAPVPEVIPEPKPWYKIW